MSYNTGSSFSTGSSSSVRPTSSSRYASTYSSSYSPSTSYSSSHSNSYSKYSSSRYSSEDIVKPYSSSTSTRESRYSGLNSSFSRLNVDSSSTSGSTSGLTSGSIYSRHSTRTRLPPLDDSLTQKRSLAGSSSLFPSSGSSEFSDRKSRSTSVTRRITDSYLKDSNNNSTRSDERSRADGSSKKQGGLRNIGNSCYLNSVIQCLLHCEPIRNYILNGKYKSEINSRSKTRGKLMDSTCSLFRDLLSGQTGSPSSVKSAVSSISGSFRGMAQEDAQEFLRYFLEGLHEDVQRVTTKPRITEEATSPRMAWSQYTSRENSTIVDLCVGQLRSSLTCDSCGYVSKVWDPFWDLSVPIPSGARDIQDCLNEFQKEEILDGSEKPKCERCKERRRMKKKFGIEKSPRVLVIHLKRFGDSVGYSRNKITKNISFPHQFRLENNSYSLKAVCNHSGGVGGGHYIAYGNTDEGWFEYNDSIVSKISESQVQSANAYLLFYTAK